MTTIGDGREAIPAAEAIDGFGDLYPRRTGINRYTVLSLDEGAFRAYCCNIHGLECECRDAAFNRGEGEVCKHIAAALYHHSETDHLETGIIQEVKDELETIADEVDHAVQRSAEAHAEAAHATAETAATDDEDGVEVWEGDPVEAFKSLLRDDGLDPDDFEVWVDEDRGSLQVEQTGYLEDEKFDTWVSFSDDLDMGYDGEADVNYLTPDRYPEVFG